ncbi:hypothetical protein ACH41H_24200 [Streptomyces sp. NPDC020800]|uniref:hypothetical protein n=1 Tax=Streptomyces sp. NPDC020800 TaxID=3365092 RepID=UPI00379F2E53
MITFPDAVTYIANRASLEDLDLFEEAARQRRDTFAQERMKALAVGDEVRLGSLKPAYLNDMQGTIRSLNNTSTSNPQATVNLDAASTWILSRQTKFMDRIPDGADTYPVTVPLSCVFPV